ncbi:MAG: amphi-Trp domain-containing protein [Gammaproteobacteria bacterium]|nr:amphi-Trp domain-containing protein [Gammaproteobacteria bacterium]
MSDKKHDKKSKQKSRASSKREGQAENDFKAELKAVTKARKKEAKAMKQAAKKLEKKAKKATQKAVHMAESVSKKRIKNQTKIQYERHMNREEAVHYFISLITGLKKGNLQFNQGKDTVVITPAELVDVEIKAETKGKMEKVTFEMAWLANKSRDISISTS